jgi:hypothetical protein
MSICSGALSAAAVLLAPYVFAKSRTYAQPRVSPQVKKVTTPADEMLMKKVGEGG